MLIDGEEIVRRIIEPAWRRHGLSPSSRTLLACECAPPDLPRALAARCGIVFDFESDAQVVSQARERHTGVRNLHFAAGGGLALSKLPKEGIDVCLSCAPLDREALGRRGVLEQLARVLKPGGLAHVRVPPPEGGFGAVLRRFVAGRSGAARATERALVKVGLVPVERTRMPDGQTWVVARKPW